MTRRGRPGQIGRLMLSGLLGLSALLLPGCTTPPGPKPTDATPALRPDESRAGQLARTLMAIWASGDTSGLEAITTEQVEYDDVPNGVVLRGRDAVRAYVGHVHAWAGRVSIEVTRLHAGPDSALAEWVMRGVQDRPVRGRIPVATGRGFLLRGATLVQVRDGRIHRAADYIDVLGLVLQLGGRVELPGQVVLPTIATPVPSER